MTTMSPAEAAAHMVAHVAEQAEVVSLELGNNDEQTRKFVADVLNNPTVQLWMELQGSRLTGQVH